MTGEDRVDRVVLGDGAAVGGDLTGRDKITAGGHVIQAAAGATVIIGAMSAAQVGDGLRALVELAGGSGTVRQAVVAFRTEFEAACRLIDVLADYKDLHDHLHQLEFECYAVLVEAVAGFPDEVDDSLVRYQIKLEDIADQLQQVAARGAVARQELVWITRLATLPAELDHALNTLDKTLLDNALRRLKQVLDLQPSQVNMRLNHTARALRLPALARALAQIRDHLQAQAGLDRQQLDQFRAGVEALVTLSRALEKLIEDHDGWQAVEALLNRVEDMLEFDLLELELAWPDLKTMVEPLYAGRTDRPSLGLMKEILALEDALVSANPDRVRKSFLSYRTRAGQLFYRLDLDLKRLCSDLRNVGEPLALVLRLTE